MDWLNLLYEILEVCLIPILGILTSYFVKYVNAKKEEMSLNAENETQKKYIALLADTITECVLATNQVYVEGLKAQGSFDFEAQKNAFELTYKSVLKILNDEAKVYLTEVYGDLETYIKKKIEAEVNKNKDKVQ